MKSIVNPDTQIMSLWNKQIYSKHTKYRPVIYLRHCIIEEDNIVVIENLLTVEVIVITIEEYDRLINNTLKEYNNTLFIYLVRRWFLVPEDLDEKSMVYVYRNKTRPVKLFDKYLSQFVILTTTDCNARCYYCYEKGSKPIYMTDKIAEDVAKYIMKKSNKDVSSHIRWFGGEPLYNSKAIDIICSTLMNNGRKYWSSMISNGYEFDDEMICRAKELWNLKNIQITLDGTHDVYIISKHFKNPSEDPFYRVINNIEKLIKNNIRVSIRLNVDNQNAENLFELIDYLHERFADIRANKALTIYPCPLFEGEDVGFVLRTKDDRIKIYDKTFALEDYIKERGFNGDRSLQITSNSVFNTVQCMADIPSSILIAPDGSLGVCEHHIEDSFFGSIYTKSNDRRWSEALKFRELAEELPECKTCWYYPRCIRLKLCPTNAICNESVRKDRERLINKSLRKTYYNYKAYLEEQNTNGDSQ